MELKDILKERRAKGMLMKIITNPALPLLAKDAGLDFLFYDCEHGDYSYSQLHDLMLMGNAIGLPSVVRAAQLQRRDVSQILDFGASGVMVPMMETREQAEQLAGWSKYPPIGIRSYSGGANTNYGPSGHHAVNMQTMNARTLTIAQIETRRGVENADEILSVKGIDAAIVGPADLGISIGNPDDVMAAEELELIQKVADSCQRHGKYFGIIGGMNLQTHFKADVRLLISGIDTHILSSGMKTLVRDYDSLDQK